MILKDFNIIVIACSSVIFVCQSPETRADILKKYPSSLKDRDLLSCRNQCGTDNYICSCTVKCQVYSNCCEDFQYVCPEELEMMDKVDHLLGSKVMCKSGHFMISSCPDDHNSDVDTTLAFQTFSTASEATSTIAVWTTQTKVTVQDVLDERPVLDLFNGVTFVNKATFECNSKNQSTPQFWNARVSIDSHGSGLITFSTLLDYKIFDHFFTQPSALWNQSERTDSCFRKAISICPRNYERVDAEVITNCSSFVSYVFGERVSRIYKNIYCFMCWEKPGAEYELIRQLPSEIPQRVGFSIILNEVPTGLQLRSMRGLLMDYLPWGRTNCLYSSSLIPQCIGEQDIGEGHDNDEYVSKNSIRIAIGKDGGPMTLDLLDMLPFLFSCVIENSLPGSEIHENQLNTRQPFEFFDRRLQMIVYSFEINVNLSNSSFDFEGFPIFEIIDILSKTVWQYRNGEAFRGSRLLNRKTKTRNLTEISEHDTVVETIAIRDVLSYYKSWYEDKAISNGSLITTSCLCMQNRSQTAICNPICWQTPYFEGDLKKINNYLSSECFAKMFSSSCIVGSTQAMAVVSLLPLLLL